MRVAGTPRRFHSGIFCCRRRRAEAIPMPGQRAAARGLFPHPRCGGAAPRRPQRLHFRTGGEYTVIRAICKDETFLAQKAEPAAPEDLQTAADLLETLAHHKHGCVGMAANMIGVNKRIIAFDNEGEYMIMFNPEIIRKSGPYDAEEGCLSLAGTRPARRWNSIKVRWQNEKFQERQKTFTGWTAQIIQHEIDHCEGILI